jgi:hypothetical protein
MIFSAAIETSTSPFGSNVINMSYEHVIGLGRCEKPIYRDLTRTLNIPPKDLMKKVPGVIARDFYCIVGFTLQSIRSSTCL